VIGWRPGWFIPLALCFATTLAAAQALRGESSEARAALDRAVEFMGGGSVVYGMRTLVIASDNTRDYEGRKIVVPTRTYYAFPLSVRQEITLNARTIAMASSPGGGTLFTADGDSPLDHATRLGVERSTMRNPVVLLKSRLGRGFGAALQGTESIDGEAVDRLRLTQQGNETVLLVARRDGRPVEIRYDLIAAGGSKRSVIVRFSDWRTGSSPLRYPYLAQGREDGKPVFEVVTRDIEVDVPLSETLFSGGSDSATYGIRPAR
jgi:hypothetical protein